MEFEKAVGLIDFEDELVMGVMSNRQTGMTLMELLVTMVIMAILMATGVPMYSSVTTQSRMNEEISGFLMDVNFARSEAIKRGQPVFICSTSDNATCNDVGSTSSVWTTGRLLYVDTTNSGLVTTPTTTNILRISPAVSHSDTFTGGTAVKIAQTGYESMTGTASLHDSSNDSSQRRCISVTAGSASITAGATCP